MREREAAVGAEGSRRAAVVASLVSVHDQLCNTIPLLLLVVVEVNSSFPFVVFRFYFVKNP